MDAIPVYQVIANDGTKAPFATQQTPGRWSSGTLHAIYVSCQASTALLEFLAHLESSLPDTLACSRMRLRPGQIEVLDSLPENWKERPYREDVQRVGDAWLASRRSLALRVPCALSPASYNLILNPAHPDHAASKADFTEVFRLDRRLM